MDANNPVYQLAQIGIPTIAKNIMENGQIGTAGKRLMDRICIAVIKSNFFFNNNSTRLQGENERINKFFFFTRKGWRERQNPDYPFEDYDWLGLQEVQELSENIPVLKSIKADFKWNEWAFVNTEKQLNQLVALFNNMLFKELPVIIEKRYINTIVDSINNGVVWINDQALQQPAYRNKVAQIPTWTVNYNTPEDTKAALKVAKNIINNMITLDNPLVYYPDTSDFVMLVNPRFDDAIQELEAYQAFGDRVISNKKTEGALSNSPIKFFKDKVQVIMNKEIPEWLPFIIWPKNNAFDNMVIFFTSPPTSFKSVTGYIGKSPSWRYFAIESGSFSDGKISYWGTKAGVIAAGINGGGAITKKGVQAYFSDPNPETGEVTVKVVINTFDLTPTLADGFYISIVDEAFGTIGDDTYHPEFNETSGAFELEATLTNVPTSSYQIKVDIDSTIDADAGEGTRKLWTSERYQVVNRTYTQPMLGSVVNSTDIGVNVTLGKSHKDLLKEKAKPVVVNVKTKAKPVVVNVKTKAKPVEAKETTN